MSRVGGELAVAWMIDGFDANDALGNLRVVTMQVLQQAQLGLRRSGNENFGRIAQRFDDGVEIMLIFRKLA